MATSSAHSSSRSSWKPEQAASRLGLVQQVLREAPETKGEEDPALLVVPGIDGSYNVNSQRIFKFLFLGASGEQLVEPTIEEESEMLEDCFLVILKNGVKVYYGPEAKQSVRKLISLWPNVEEFRLLAGDFGGDAEKMERYKIQSFINMLKDHQTVVLPTNSIAEENHETFPLVQAFGLDEFKTGGFLSAKKTILHIGLELGLLWKHIDDVDGAADTQGKLLMQHWNTCLRLVTRQLNEKGSLELENEETSPFEPIHSFFEFGTIKSPSLCEKDCQSRQSGASSRFSGDKNFLNVRGEDYSNGVRVARTYFVDGNKSLDTVRLYGALVTSYQTILSQICETPEEAHFAYLRDPSRARASRRLKNLAFDSLKSVLQKSDCSFELKDQSDLKLTLESFDLAGQRVDAEALSGTFENAAFKIDALHYLQLELTLKNETTPLSIGDTFVVPKDKSVFVLTKDAPNFLCWHSPSQQDNLEASIELLGKILPGRRKTPTCMYFGRESFRSDIGMLNGNISFYEKGFIFENLAFGKLVFNLEKENHQVSTWNAIANTNGENVSVATFSVSDEELAVELKEFNCGLCNCVAFVTNGFAEVSDAIHFYKDTEMVESINDDISKTAVVANAFRGSDLYKMFKQQLETSSSNSTMVNSSSLSLDVESKQDSGFQNVYIISGSAGSGKSAVAKSFSKRFHDCPLVENDLIHAIHFDASRLRKQLAKLGKEQNIVIVTPGDTVPEDVMKIVVENLQSVRFSVTCVINVQNAYSDSRQTNLIPGLLGQCALDTVHSIVLNAATTTLESDSESLQERIRGWNPRADLFQVGLCLPDNAVVTFDEEFWAHQDRVLAQARTKVPDQLFSSSSSSSYSSRPRHVLESVVVHSAQATISRNRLTFALQRLTKRKVSRDPLSENVQAAPPVAPSSSSVSFEDIDLENLGSSGNQKSIGIRSAQKIAKQKIFSKKVEQADRIDIEKLQLPPGEYLSVSGYVSFAEEPTKWHCVSAACGHVRILPVSKEKLPKSDQKRTFGLLFQGVDLAEKQQLVDFVSMLQPKLTPLIGRLTAETVPARQRAQIDKSLVGEDLPSGYWFDGRSYMDHTGIPLDHHPKFQEKLQEWIETQNEKIEKHNKNASKRLRERSKMKISAF